jgi:hypothetical protein
MQVEVKKVRPLVERRIIKRARNSGQLILDLYSTTSCRKNQQAVLQDSTDARRLSAGAEGAAAGGLWGGEGQALRRRGGNPERITGPGNLGCRQAATLGSL